MNETSGREGGKCSRHNVCFEDPSLLLCVSTCIDVLRVAMTLGSNCSWDLLKRVLLFFTHSRHVAFPSQKSLTKA
jgi:hypothetical protein